MKPSTSHLLAALLVGAAPLAFAQSAPPVQGTPAEPAKPQPAYVAEPVASVSRDDPVAGTIAQALNADAALKNSKITVQPGENGVILLTGATTSEASRIRATQIAQSHAGDGQVVNTLAHDENVIWVPDPQPAAGEMEEAAEGEEAVEQEEPAATDSSGVAQG